MSTTTTVRRTVATAAAAAALLVSAAGAVQPAHATTTTPTYGQAVPGVAPAELADSAKYLDADGRVLLDPQSTAATPPKATSADAALIGCTPISGRDNPHYSSGDISGHG